MHFDAGIIAKKSGQGIGFQLQGASTVAVQLLLPKSVEGATRHGGIAPVGKG